MSGTAPIPQPPTASLAWRVLRTPVSDLVRGRIEPLVDAERVIAGAGLPAALADLVGRVVRRARLWRHERIEVARDLVAHFEDGLAAGVSADELAASFGDPVQAAKLIRRAVRRNRPWAWRVMKFTQRAILTLVFGTVALALLVYGIQAARIYGGRVNVARNYAAEWNAPILAVPEAERAWPVYRAAALELGTWPRSWDDLDLYPGSAAWDEVVAFTKEHAGALELFRRAAGMPKLAWILRVGVTEEDAPLINSGGRPAPPPPEDGPFLWVLLPPASVLRDGGRLLSVDAQLAAAADDPRRAEESLLGMLQVVDHARETRFLIADLVAIAVTHHTCRVLGALLHEAPALFSDEQLTALAHRLAAVGEGSLRIRLDSERAMFADLLQRYYTDDGSGDGLPRSKLAEIHWGVGDDLEWGRGYVGAWFMPALSTMLAGRRETQEKYEYFLSRYEIDLDTPLWERQGRGVHSEIEELAASRWSGLRYWTLLNVLPALDRAVLLGDLAEQVRDATLAAIALQLYHRRHGGWPATLDQLTPQWLPQVPVDRFDGKPLRYRLVDGQPLLYSVGADRDDDGGRLPELPKLGPDAPRRRWQCNRAAMQWQPLPDSDQPAPAGCPDGDWLLWPPVLN